MTNKDKMVGYELEYNTLRAEILQNQKNSLQIITFSLTGTAVILGIAANSIFVGNDVVIRGPEMLQNWMFVLPLVILVPSYYLYLTQVAATFKLGAYIRVFLEPECEQLNYETLWSKYIGRDPKDTFLEKCHHTLSNNASHLIFWLLMLTCFSIFIYRANSLCIFFVFSICIGISLIPAYSFFKNTFDTDGQAKKWIDAAQSGDKKTGLSGNCVLSRFKRRLKR